MPRYALTITYDGTDFCGWQKQEPPAGPASTDRPAPDPAKLLPAMTPVRPGRVVLRSVQAVVEDAVRRVVREPVVLKGASRTDAGVHARSQVAAFTASSGADRGIGWPEQRGCEPLRRAINARLPVDVLVTGAALVADSFDPIADCVRKGYAYSIIISEDRPVFARRFAAQVKHPLDLDAMRRAASAFVGEHDFAAFAAANHGRHSTVRTIHACTVTESPPLSAPGLPAHEGVAHGADGSRSIRIDICGNGFLYNMVRIVAGTLAEVGRGRIDPGSIVEIIESGDRRRAGPTMPPQGLCLEWIEY